MRFGAPIVVLCALCFANCFAVVSIIKIIVVGQKNEPWAQPIVDFVNDVVHREEYAPQMFETAANSPCEVIGQVDRAKLPNDFILVARQQTGQPLECEAEWGKTNFAIWQVGGNVGQVAFVSNEAKMSGAQQWHSVGNVAALFDTIVQRAKFHPTSQIPDEYPFVAEREKRVQRRIYMACIAILTLFVCALLVIMFMTSLARYNLRKQERVKAKKAEKEQPKQVEKKKEIGKSAESSEHDNAKEKLVAAQETVKEKEKEKEKEASEKSEKSEKSKKSEHSEDPLRSKRSNDSLAVDSSKKM